MSIVVGEVVHIVKCVHIDVDRCETDRCYQELPVIWNGQNIFLTPKTHLLKTRGTANLSARRGLV